MRRVPLLCCLAAMAAVAGCGFGPGDEQSGKGVGLRVTRDFGHELLSSEKSRPIREGETVMRLLRSSNEVGTRFGGAFVQSIDGLEGRGVTGAHDWFFYVNGIESDRGAADYELSPGDVVTWDYRDWGAAMGVRAIVGAFPQPFLGGLDGKRFPVRVECEDASGDPCEEVKARLRDLGVPATGASLGAPGTQRVARVVVATWSRARELPSARQLERGPKISGVFARFAEDGAALELLGEDGETARTDRAGGGLVAALRPTDNELLWLVVGVDDAGVANAAEAFRARDLRDAFAVAAGPKGVHKLPLEIGK
jgi:hypothetical protein